MIHSKRPFLEDSSAVRAMAWIQAFCGIVFAIDIFYETHIELLAPAGISTIEAVHVSVEAAAVIGLFYGYFLANRQLKRLRMQEGEKAHLLGSLRGRFDDIILAQFEKWGLSKAETDVALLTIRGLRIAQIACMRNTREGTIKAQLSSILHKSGMTTRTEFLAFFMDEILDFGAEDGQHGEAAPVLKPGSSVVQTAQIN